MKIKSGETLYIALYRRIDHKLTHWNIAGYKDRPHYTNSSNEAIREAKDDLRDFDHLFEYKTIAITAPE